MLNTSSKHVWYDLINDIHYNIYPYMQKKYGDCIGWGFSRITWKTKNGNVIKIPRNGKGISDNDWEASVCESEIYPKTKGIWKNETVICIMEHIEHTFKSYDELPDWVGSIDCKQVGYTKNNKLKAYDYGL